MFMFNGFAQQIENLSYSKNLIEKFSNSFNYLPLGAIINQKIFCVHGGIGVGFTDLCQLKAQQRPIERSASDPIESAVWSDPLESENYFTPSTRGIGFTFNEKAITAFLHENSFDVLVRGHERVDGIAKSLSDHVITVFGASSYCGVVTNPAGVLIAARDGHFKTIIMRAIKYLPRSRCLFMPLARCFKELKANSSMPSLPSLVGLRDARMGPAMSLMNFGTKHSLQSKPPKVLPAAMECLPRGQISFRRNRLRRATYDCGVTPIIIPE
jgi:protein phosphatase